MMSSCHPNPQWCHHVTQTHSCPSCCSSWAVCCRSFTLPTHAVWGAFLFSSLQTKRCMMSPKTAVIFHITVPDLQSLWCLHLMHLAKCHLKCHLSHDGSGFTVPVVPSPSAPCQMSPKTIVIFHFIVLDLQSLRCLCHLHLSAPCQMSSKTTLIFYIIFLACGLCDAFPFHTLPDVT